MRTEHSVNQSDVFNPIAKENLKHPFMNIQSLL